MPTMMRDAAISFPMLGGLTLDFPASFTLFGHTFYLYGVVMAIAFIAAVFYASKKAPRVGIRGDDIFGLVLWVLPIAIVGCRIYYVIAEWDRYKDNFWDVFKIWEGGIAMYGGTIAGVITVIVWSRVKKIRFGATLDVASSGLILGQVIGRWANFVNREAFGRETDIFCRMGLTTPDGTTYYVHPTFLYESLWNLVGFIIIDRYWYRKDHRKYDGQIFIFYVLWYGAGRACVEGLRTDSLYIPGTNIRTSQLVAAVSALVALVVLLVNIKRPHRPQCRTSADLRRKPAPKLRPKPTAKWTTTPKLKKRRKRTMSDYNELIKSLKAAAGGFADIAKDLAGAAGDKARDLAGGAGEKAKALARLAKLTMELNSERDSLEEAYAEVGKLYFENADKTDPGEMYVRAFDRVMLSLAAIERMETELNELRSYMSESSADDAGFEDIVDAAEAEAAGDDSIEVEITEDKTEE